MGRGRVLSIRSRIQRQQRRYQQQGRQGAAFGLWREDQDYESDDSSTSAVESDEDDHGNACHLVSALPTHFLGVAIQRREESLDDDDDDDDDGEPNAEPDEDEMEQETSSSRLLPQLRTTHDEESPAAQAQPNPNVPPSPWGTSKSKQRIIDELRKGPETSPIFCWIGSYSEEDWSEVKFEKIRDKYASNQYKMSNFKPNVKRLLTKLAAKTGEFAPEQVEPWYTSAKNMSKAYCLLYTLHMDPKKSCIVNTMTARQLWESHPEFQLYALEKFKTYNDNMKKLTSKRKDLIRAEEAACHRDMLKLPPNTRTNRGLPFWHRHLAAKLLVEDVKSGKSKTMKPCKLWESRKEYQDFPLRIFRKHIYQERTKQLAAPYWQHKRNKIAQKQFEEEVDKLADDWERVKVTCQV